jgi:Na+/melibiose symporter-like transporter
MPAAPRPPEFTTAREATGPGGPISDPLDPPADARAAPVPAHDSAAARGVSAASLWHHRDFMKLWVGETVSEFGSQVTVLALPFAAAVVLQATPAEMGVLSALQMLPFLLISLPAGVWVDRLRRRPILITADVVRGLTLLAVPIAGITGHLSIPLLYAVSLIAGGGTVFFDVSYQSYMPALVERDHLIDGNSKMELSRSAAQFGGPGVGGVLIGLVGAAQAVLVDSLSFFFSAAMLLWIRTREPAPVPRRERRHMVHEIRDGLRVVLGNPLLRSIAATTATSNLFSSISFATLVLFATRDLRLDAIHLGIVFALANVGAMAGALLAGRMATRMGLGNTLMGAIFVGSLANLLVPVAVPATALPLLLVAMFVGTAGSTVYNINQVSLRQSITPDWLQGRMNASMRFLVWGVFPVGSLVGGALGTLIGVRAGIAVGAVGGLLTVLWLVFSPVRTLRAPPPPWEPDAGAPLA